MATAGNMDWAYAEAKRRAVALARPYAIYQHRRNTADHIIKPVEAGPPAPLHWTLLDTVQP